MFVVFFLLFLVSIVALLIGLIRPGTVIRWGTKRTRKRVGLIYGVAAVVLMIASGASAPKTAAPPSKAVSAVASNTGSASNMPNTINNTASNAPSTADNNDASATNGTSSGSNNATSVQTTNSTSTPNVPDNNSSSTDTSTTNNSASSTSSPASASDTSAASTSNTTKTTSTTSAPITCRADWSAGVYHTYRFDLLSSCKTATGTVEAVIHEADHDYHLRLKLDAKYNNLLAPGNTKYQYGDLVIEIIPMDQPYVPIPTVGEHITVTGAWVDDKDHAWNEIHPAWIVNGKGHIGYTAAAAQQSVITGICGNGDKDCPTGSTGSSSGSSSSTEDSGPPTSTPGLTVVSSTLNVSPGSMASIKVKTKPGAQGQITVEYSSGASKSKSLYPKTADSQGYITWTWKVGSTTKAGDWPVTITADGKTIQLTLHVK